MLKKAPLRLPAPVYALACALVCAPFLASCAPPAPDAAEETAVEATVQAPVAPEVESQIPAEFRALGTEPFWAVTNGTAGMRYSTPEDSDGTLVTIEEERSELEKRRFSGSLGEKTFSIELTIKPCSDGMSDRQYPFTAHITLDELELEGCARPMDG